VSLLASQSTGIRRQPWFTERIAVKPVVCEQAMEHGAEPAGGGEQEAAR